MNINLDIIFEHLGRTLAARRLGGRCKSLSLKRTAFLDPKKTPHENTVYLCTAESLIKYGMPKKDVSIICIDGTLPSRLLKDGNPVVCLENLKDVIQAFNQVQEVFAYYDEWDDRLMANLNESSDVREMIECSVPVLGNPLFINDRDLKVTVYTEFEATQGDFRKLLPAYRVLNTDTPASAATVSVLKETLKRGSPRLGSYELSGIKHLFVRLRRAQHELGSLTVGAYIQGFRPFDALLLEHLADRVEQAMRNLKGVKPNDAAELRTMLKDLLRGYSVSEHSLRVFTQSHGQLPWTCCCLRPVEGDTEIPIHYIYESIKSLLGEVVVFEHESLIVCFSQIDEARKSAEKVLMALDSFVEKINFKIGVSNPFKYISESRYHFLQARCALLTGYSLDPDRNHYPFSSYALPYMLQNAVGELPIKYLCPPSLERLRDLDANSDVGYWDTLRTYLNNGMQATKTARDLFIHRSTLLLRIDRIREVAGISLDDPSQRLYIHICILASDLLC